MILRHGVLIFQIQQYRYYITIAQIEPGCNMFVEMNCLFRVSL